MPLVEIALRSGKKPEYIRAVADAVHESLVATINIPADDRFQIIHQTTETELIAHPSYGGVSRSSDLIIIKVTLSTGRSVEIKKNLYMEMTGRLQKAADVRPDDVVICLIEVVKENWSFGGGRAMYAT